MLQIIKFKNQDTFLRKRGTRKGWVGGFLLFKTHISPFQKAQRVPASCWAESNSKLYRISALSPTLFARAQHDFLLYPRVT